MWQMISYSQLNAPVVADGNGQLLTMLDACLIDGFNEQSVAHYADGVLTFGGLHGYIKNQCITISDSMGIGNYKIKDVSGNQVILYEKPILQGQITTKITPLGWESMFGNDDPLRRAYRSKNDKSSKTVLFLDMTYPENHGYHATKPARRAMVTMCEDMAVLGVPINDYTAEINNKSTHVNGSLFWYQKRAYYKYSNVENSAVPWHVIGNGEFFYMIIGFSGGHDLFAFGDFGQFSRPVFGCLCMHTRNDNGTFSTVNGAHSSKIAGVAIIDGKASLVGINHGCYTSGSQLSGSFGTYQGELVALPMYVLLNNQQVDFGVPVAYLPNLFFLPYDMINHQQQWLDDMYIMPMGHRTNSINRGAYGLYSPS